MDKINKLEVVTEVVIDALTSDNSAMKYQARLKIAEAIEVGNLDVTAITELVMVVYRQGKADGRKQLKDEIKVL